MSTSFLTQIADAQKSATSYPDLVKRFIAIGIESYTVDVATGITLYRFGNGNCEIKSADAPLRTIAQKFDEQLVIESLRKVQQGEIDYPAWMNEVAKAACRFYEAVLEGSNKRVIYIGTGGSYEETIPL